MGWYYDIFGESALPDTFPEGTAPHRIVAKHAAAAGVLTRALPFVPVNSFSPPLTIKAEDIEIAADRYAAALRAATAELEALNKPA